MIEKTIWNKVYGLYIGQDECPEDPRDNYNQWIIICNHRRYDLWDEKLINYWKDMEYDMVIYFNNKYSLIILEDNEPNTNEVEFISKWIDWNIIWETLYLMDHSGISMSTKSFWCQWDSWVVWFIYCQKWLDNLTDKELRSNLIAEVKEYDYYLKWEVYYYSIKEKKIVVIDWELYSTEWDILDSCSWFYNLENISKDINSDIFTKEEILNYNF
jgi:hypothetical protein